MVTFKCLLYLFSFLNIVQAVMNHLRHSSVLLSSGRLLPWKTFALPQIPCSFIHHFPVRPGINKPVPVHTMYQLRPCNICHKKDFLKITGSVVQLFLHRHRKLLSQTKIPGNLVQLSPDRLGLRKSSRLCNVRATEG